MMRAISTETFLFWRVKPPLAQPGKNEEDALINGSPTNGEIRQILRTVRSQNGRLYQPTGSGEIAGFMVRSRRPPIFLSASMEAPRASP